MQKLSIYSSFSSKYSIEERMAAIKEVGFDAVCLDFEKELEVTEGSWETQLRLAQKYLLPVENVHLTSSGMTAIWSGDDAGDKVIDRLIQEVADMASLGITTGVTHVTWGYDRPAGNMESGLHRYERVAEVAEKYGVRLALENSVYPEYVRYLLDNLKSDNIGFCYDSGHENAFSRGENFLVDYSDRLFAMHLHDNDGIQDMHSLPMTGNIDWENVIIQLRRSPLFETTLTLECIISLENLEEGLRSAYEAGKRIQNFKVI